MRSGKTRTAVEVAVRAAVECEPLLETDIIDLAQERVSILDGRSFDKQYTDDTVDVVNRIKSGTVFLLATPIYRGSYTGALKNLLDHLPLEALEGKVVGLIATGATSHHYLAIDHQLRGVLAWFNAYVLPGCVYLDSSSYSDGELSDQEQAAHLRQLGESLVTVSRRLEDVPAMPPCLARQMMKTGRG